MYDSFFLTITPVQLQQWKYNSALSIVNLSHFLMVMGGRKVGGQQKQFHLLATVLPGTSVSLLIIFFLLQINSNIRGLYSKLIYEVLSELQYCMLSPIPGTLDFCVYAHVYIYMY